MNCYCEPLLFELNVQIFDLSFSEFKDRNGEPDQTKYCGEWTKSYFIQNALLIGSSVVVVLINVITCFIFEKISFVERQLTVNDETKGQFQKITIMQFINIALVVLLINFNLIDGLFLGFIPILDGSYPDFTAFWYAQIGQQLCLTLMLNIFSPHFSKIALPLLKGLRRCYDRGCKF